MTAAEELWQAVVSHCKPGRGYRIGVAPHNVWNACRSFDEMVKAESEAF